MANNNDKFGEIKEVLDYFDKSYKNIQSQHLTDLKARQLDIIKEVADEEKRVKNQLYEEIFELEAEGKIKTEEQAAKYARKLAEENLKYKLQEELDILKSISKEQEEERKLGIKSLEKEKEIIEKRNDGNIKAAKKAEKELSKIKKDEEQLKRKKRLKEEGLGYEFGDNLKSIFEPLKDEIASGNAFKKSADKALLNTLKSVGKAISEGLNVINRTISEYAKYQTSINARLQGKTTFGELVDKLDTVAFSPLISANDLYSNLNQLVGQGIVTNVEQRAFFQTIKDGIATTFDTTSESLNRIIRIQRNDSTAARLGMESYLTRFLNVYVENTEYLQSTFDNVASSLLEASAVIGELKGVNASVEFEYVVQKWLGTLTGIGLSSDTAQKIASSLGQLGAGDVDVLNSDMGRLLTMSATTIGKNIGEILNNGLDAFTTNSLLSSMVKYLQTIADNGTNVTKAELAKIFGVSISDLVAVAKMDQAAIKTINDDLLSYTGMYTELRDQFNQLPSRMGISNILENLFSNLTYQTGMSIASNPASYAMWKITDLIQGVTGGINIPFITALGTGIDLNTTAENLMKLALVGVNMFGKIPEILNGISTVFKGRGEILLDKLNIDAGTGNVKTFGEGLTLDAKKFRNTGMTTSQTVYIGQEDSDAYYNSTINSEKAKSSKELKTITNDEENNPALKIYNYLSNTVDLKTNVIALTAAATTTSDILTKINSDDGSITKALHSINNTLTGDILSAIKKVTVSYGNVLFDKTAVISLFNTENTLINSTAATNISTVNGTSPVIDYFETIGFAEGFKDIVDNIKEINKKIPADFGAGAGFNVGFTQYGRG